MSSSSNFSLPFDYDHDVQFKTETLGEEFYLQRGRIDICCLKEIVLSHSAFHSGNVVFPANK